MNPSADEKITTHLKEPREAASRLLPPAISILLRWGFFALIAIGVVLSVVLGLVQKWLWMRQLDYAGIFWTLLSVKWGIFGVALFVSIIYLWINLRFAARNIDRVGWRAASSARRFKHPADASRTINIDLSPKLLVFAIDCGNCGPLAALCAWLSGQWDTFLRFGMAARLELRTRFLASTWGSMFSAFHSMNCCREALLF